MFNWFLRLFGFGKKPVPDTEIVTETASLSPVRPPAPGTPTRKNVDRTKYYRRNGNFYSQADDSLIEDLLMVAILVEMFDEPDYVPQDDVAPVESVADSVAEIDAAVEQVREETSAPEVTYTAPEPYRVPDPAPDYSSSDSSSSDYSSSDSSSSYD